MKIGVSKRMYGDYPSHIRIETDGSKTIQTVAEHLRNTAEYCSANLTDIGLNQTGYFLGLTHDIGKMYDGFKEYIEAASEGQKVIRGSVNHSFSAVKLIMTMFHPEKCGSINDIKTELLAYAMAAHHGTVDLCSPEATFAFRHRIEYDEKIIGYETVKSTFFSEIISEEDFRKLYADVCEELEPIFKEIFRDNARQSENNFHLGMLSRLLLSALVDADRRDTAEFMSGQKICPVDSGGKDFWNPYLENLENRLSQFKSDAPINVARKYISDECSAYASEKEDISRLTVPTGAGKTLSSLRYALSKAKIAKKRRIFFFIPLLSVIEQNASIIEDVIGDDKIILEHHSNVFIDPDDYTSQERYAGLSQNWNSPIVISTLVQLLNTLFDGSNSSARRMCALCNSIVIIDEIQSLPRKTIDLFNSAINFLTKFCGTTVVLCSATQPEFEESKNPMDIGENADMVKHNPEIWKYFERTEILDVTRPSGYSCEEISDKALEIAETYNSLLIICNTKAVVRKIYEQLEITAEASKIQVFHLSTSMCMAHRKKTLADINAALDAGQKIICVSSQLVEAGVDFSFDCVIRSLSGLDNIAQAAGRCNRNGRVKKRCPVYVMNFKDENLSRLRDISDSQNAFRKFSEFYKKDSAKYENDLLSDESIKEYYHQLFSDCNVNNNFSYPCPELNTYIYSMLSDNRRFIQSQNSSAQSPYFINQAFKTAGTQFSVFDDSTIDIIVPYSDEGKQVINELCSERAKHDLRYLNKTIKVAAQFSVSIYDYQKKLLEENGALYSPEDLPVIILKDGFYKEAYGLDINGTSQTDYIL